MKKLLFAAVMLMTLDTYASDLNRHFWKITNVSNFVPPGRTGRGYFELEFRGPKNFLGNCLQGNGRGGAHPLYPDARGASNYACTVTLTTRQAMLEAASLIQDSASRARFAEYISSPDWWWVTFFGNFSPVQPDGHQGRTSSGLYVQTSGFSSGDHFSPEYFEGSAAGPDGVYFVSSIRYPANKKGPAFDKVLQGALAEASEVLPRFKLRMPYVRN